MAASTDNETNLCDLKQLVSSTLHQLCSYASSVASLTLQWKNLETQLESTHQSFMEEQRKEFERIELASNELKSAQKSFEYKLNELGKREEQFDTIGKELDLKQKQFEADVEWLKREIHDFNVKIFKFKNGVEEFDTGTKQLEKKSQELELKEKQLEEKSREFELKEIRLEERSRKLELKQGNWITKPPRQYCTRTMPSGCFKVMHTHKKARCNNFLELAIPIKSTLHPNSKEENNLSLYIYLAIHLIFLSINTKKKPVMADNQMNLCDLKRQILSSTLDQLHSHASSVVSLTLQWKTLETQFQSTQSTIEERAKEVSSMEQSILEGLEKLKNREKLVELMEESVNRRKMELDEKDKGFGVVGRELKITVQEQKKEMERIELMSKELEESLGCRLEELGRKEEQFKLMTDAISKDLDLNHKQYKVDVEWLQGEISDLSARILNFRTCVEEFDMDTELLKERSRELNLKEEQLEQKSTELEIKDEEYEKKFELKEKQLEENSRQLDLKEKQLEEKSREFKIKDEEYEKRLKELELKEKQLKERTQKLESKERNLIMKPQQRKRQYLTRAMLFDYNKVTHDSLRDTNKKARYNQ
ncbi:uncharacterized protein LOC126680611 [Mercurialis annua]|uniref:uncharacterized protein LOC126680611 n=1 Tax=Mercurialis annua TaxID=3986 RepID=UPI002160FB92|nr:uncharacterized protein LOC126680611 [Mercurialis annua]